MKDDEVQVVAETYIYLGCAITDPDLLADAQREIQWRFERAAGSGLTERHVVVELLMPIFSGDALPM